MGAMQEPKRERHWFQSRKIALLQCGLTLATTTISWLIAFCLGHVKLWPIPMVSYCGVHAPEKYVFTMGLVCSAFLMFLFIWVIETADKIYSSKTTAWLLGFPCSIGLMLLAVCNCQDEPTAHYIGAVAYFGCFALWCVCCSFKEIGLEGNDRWPRVRKILSVMIIIMTAIMLYLLAIKDKIDEGRIPVLEWSAVICSELFVGTFWCDLGDDFYIEQVEVKGRTQAINKQKKIESA